ncbi:PP2C family protein-serine/threonine phosphatase [Kitasatospora aureofaciens]|uniref:PP2C family protein-serine/threonine phosphatase n=1 Tax=Kitasatospora aureofaciens TaxID=1894 RepID=UPI001D96687E|nr:PP2C family protein-serine/threonine phosphatase [Kitasatospora aureofaciens]HJD82350.1 serine/threonine-protein phosphatase [Kitasatospora aureofaciens]
MRVRSAEVNRLPQPPSVPGTQLPVLVRYGHRSWLIPAVLLVAVVVVDALTPSSFASVSWLALVPVVAAGLCGPPATVVFCCLAIAMYPALDSIWAKSQGVEDFLLVVAGCVLALRLSVFRAQAAAYVRHLQGAAETTRQVVLRPVPPGWGGVDSAARYLAADVEARVGGDFYDVVASPFGARVVLGDVQGKGLPAVSTAAALVGCFREAAFREPDLATLASRLEERVHRQNLLASRLGEEEERFVTAVVIWFPDDAPEEIQSVNFGHDSPHVLGPDGVRKLPPGSGAPLGLAGLAGLVGGLPEVQRLRLGTDETVLIVSDGVTEARDRQGDFFDLREYLDELVGGPGATAPERLVEAVAATVVRHTGGRCTDDTALLAVRHSPVRLSAEPGTCGG